MKAETQIILMDADTGVDDALAILLALHAPELEVVGITTVSGNTSSEQAAWNTIFVLHQFKLANVIPVVIGAAKSLQGRMPIPAPEIHGIDGLGGVSSQFWKNSNERIASHPQQNAVDFILAMSKKYGSSLSIVGTGPLTNIALAIQRDRTTIAAVSKIVLMGGALETSGNITKFAEFNAHCDPEAFGIVLSSGIPVTLFPLDVTEKVRILASTLTPELGISKIKLELIKAVTQTFFDFHQKHYGFKGSYIHDALPVASLIDPSLFRFRVETVVVEQSFSERVGQLRRARPGEDGAEIKVAMDINEKRFLDLFWSYLRRSI